jgi:hypothetical protein
VALINPDQPSSATAVPVIPPGTIDNPGPQNIVTTNTSKALIEPKSFQDSGCGASLYELDLSTLQVTTVSYIPDFCIQPEGFPIAASADGSRVLVSTLNSSPQQVAIYDAATNEWKSNFGVGEVFGASAAISADGSTLVSSNGLFDANADLLGYLSWQDVFESGTTLCASLEKVPDGGSLVYIPYPSFVDIYGVPHSSYVDIFDVNHGALVRRVTLAEQIQQVTDAMTIDAFGQNIYLITNAGLTIVQLGNAPLSIADHSFSEG